MDTIENTYIKTDITWLSITSVMSTKISYYIKIIVVLYLLITCIFFRKKTVYLVQMTIDTKKSANKGYAYISIPNHIIGLFSNVLMEKT